MASFPRVLVVPLCFLGVYLPVAVDLSINYVSINVDDHLRQVYLDEKNITLVEYDVWDLPDIIPMSDSITVIAVFGHNMGQGASLVASDLGGWVFTDALWKYSTVFSPNWYKVNFNDSTWNYSHLIKSANDGYGGWRFRCVSRHASLIWSPNYHDAITDTKLYFRLRIQRDRLRRNFDLIQSDAKLANVNGCVRSRRLQCAASCSQMTSLCVGFQHNKATRECCLLTVAQLKSHNTKNAPGWNIWSSIVLNESC